MTAKIIHALRICSPILCAGELCPFYGKMLGDCEAALKLAAADKLEGLLSKMEKEANG